jgi:hypothetical protein
MISKEVAAAAAEEIIALERARLAEIQDAKALHIPMLLRVEGLSTMAPRHQAALLREADRGFERKLSFWAWVLAWLASIAIVWYYSQAGTSSTPLLWAFMPAVGVLSIRRWFQSRELQRLLSVRTAGSTVG